MGNTRSPGNEMVMCSCVLGLKYCIDMCVSDAADGAVEKIPFSRIVERSLCMNSSTHAWCATCSQYERQVERATCCQSVWLHVVLHSFV